MLKRRFLCKTLCLLLGVAACADRMQAGVIYVDNRTGSDRFDGKAARPLNADVGPLYSLRSALARSKPGDTIQLADNGIPYFGSATLSGGRHSALGHVRLIIEGNGAVIDGSQSIPPDAWREVQSRLWKVTPFRKGYYQLILDGSPVPEHPVSSSTLDWDEIPEGHWAVWRGSIYYRGAVGEDPREQPFRFARDGVGISLYGVRGITIRNLTVRHFRVDGISAPNNCRDVLLENVRLVDNGRSGLSVGGSSHVTLQNGQVADNREHQLLISGLGAVEVVDSELSEPPTFAE